MADFNTDILTIYYPEYNYCLKQSLNESTMNLTAIFANVNTPNSPYVTYKGVQTIPWTGKKAIEFEVDPLYEAGET